MKLYALFLFLWPVAAWVRTRTVPITRLLLRAVETLDFTEANVDSVLEQVRPYLISDGGNIKIVRVDAASKSVFVELQGACGSCPSSTTTMKMGVEVI